jgi:hypothetical protein
MAFSTELARRVGVIVTTPSVLRAGCADDPVGIVALQTTFVDLPRGRAARSMGESVRKVHPEAEVMPYVWHLVSHGVADGLRSMGTRTLAGPPHQFGELQQTREVDQAWEATEACASALQARRVILRTGPSLTPGAIGRGRLQAFVARSRDAGLDLVWEPEGLWEHDVAADLAYALGLPWIAPAIVGRRLVSDWPLGAWLRVDGTGPGGALDERQSMGLAGLLEDNYGMDHTLVLFSGSRAYPNLRRVVALMEG